MYESGGTTRSHCPSCIAVRKCSILSSSEELWSSRGVGFREDEGVGCLLGNFEGVEGRTSVAFVVGLGVGVFRSGLRDSVRL